MTWHEEIMPHPLHADVMREISKKLLQMPIFGCYAWVAAMLGLPQTTGTNKRLFICVECSLRWSFCFIFILSSDSTDSTDTEITLLAQVSF